MQMFTLPMTVVNADKWVSCISNVGNRKFTHFSLFVLNHHTSVFIATLPLNSIKMCNADFSPKRAATNEMLKEVKGTRWGKFRGCLSSFLWLSVWPYFVGIFFFLCSLSLCRRHLWYHFASYSSSLIIAFFAWEQPKNANFALTVRHSQISSLALPMLTMKHLIWIKVEGCLHFRVFLFLPLL